MRPLSGRRLLVVGASSGIGRAVAEGAGQAGARVALAARRPGPLREAATRSGSAARAFTADVTDAGSVGGLVRTAAEWLGGLDCVVYAAGRSTLGAVAQTGPQDWATLLATNVTGAALVLAACLPHLQEADRPCAVVLSSHAVERPWPGLVPYAASKAALDALARGLRAEEPWLRVVRVAVGNTATGFADSWDPALAHRSMTRWLEEGYLRHRVLEPGEVAAAVLAAVAGDGPDDVEVLGEVDPADPMDPAGGAATP